MAHQGYLCLNHRDTEGAERINRVALGVRGRDESLRHLLITDRQTWENLCGFLCELRASVVLPILARKPGHLDQRLSLVLPGARPGDSGPLT